MERRFHPARRHFSIGEIGMRQECLHKINIGYHAMHDKFFQSSLHALNGCLAGLGMDNELCQ